MKIITWGRHDGWHHPVVEPANSQWALKAQHFRSCEKALWIAGNKKAHWHCCGFNSRMTQLHLLDWSMKALTANITDDTVDSWTDAGLQRQREKERNRRAGMTERRNKAKSRTGMGKKKGRRDCLPRRACFILGLSMVTVAVLLPLTETWLHPSVHTLFLTHTHAQHLSL